MQYKFGDTFITVKITRESDGPDCELIWRCNASIGGEQFIEVISPVSRYDVEKHVEFDFMRIVARELCDATAKILSSDSIMEMQEKE
jgi:hypothetical protein